MEQYQGIEFEKMVDLDVNELKDIMKRAFDEDAKRHLGEDSGGPEGYDNGNFIRNWYFKTDVNAYKISKDGKVVGGIALWINPNHNNYLGNVFIDPNYQDKGIGTIVWNFVEYKYPLTKKWSTDTPGFSKRNHHFYVNKCKFKVIRIEHPGEKYEESYILEKVMNID